MGPHNGNYEPIATRIAAEMGVLVAKVSELEQKIAAAEAKREADLREQAKPVTDAEWFTYRKGDSRAWADAVNAERLDKLLPKPAPTLEDHIDAVNNILKKYSYPPLSPEAEKELLALIQSQEARDDR